MKHKPPSQPFLAIKPDKSVGTWLKGFTLVGQHMVKNYKHREECYQVLTKVLPSSVGLCLGPDF